MKEFSLYNSDKGIYQTTPTNVIDIKICANLIKEDKALTNNTKYLRSIPIGGPKIYGFKKNKTEREAFKEKFTYVTFCGTFKSRANNKLIERSEFFCIDLDHIGTIEKIREKGKLICQYYTPILMFTSPNGDGLKVVFQIDTTAGTHLDFFKAFKNFCDTQIKISIDESCKDISRACFLCHDPDVFYTESPDILGKNFILDGITETGEISGRTYEDAKKWTETRETFIDGNRNHFIVTLTDTCNRYKIDEQEVLNKIISDFAYGDFTSEEITSIVKSRYELHPEWHGIANTDIIPDKDCPYIRVGIDYFKVIYKKDRYGIERRELKKWSKDALITDHGRKYPKTIPKYDDFIMVPDNINYQPIINNCYNYYAPFCHEPAPGEWIWTERLLRHVFGEQYELGIRYMQLLYCYPKWATVILAIVSKMQKTGKTTFVNWICMLFGANASVISSKDFEGIFNGPYATKNVLMIEETLFDKKITIEKLKSLATQKQLSVNRKNIDHFNLEFFGKIILTSNYEDKFAQVNPEETRFFVRKLGDPEFKNITIEKDLLTEIPAFLYYLKNLPPISENIDRSGFTADELKNEFLTAVIEESRYETTKELKLSLIDYFDNKPNLVEFLASAKDIKEKFFNNDYRTRKTWIIRVLKEDFEMMPEEKQRYTPFEGLTIDSKVGTPYLFKRKDFCRSVENLKDETIPF